MAENTTNTSEKPKVKKSIIQRIKELLGFVKNVKQTRNTTQDGVNTNESYIQDTTINDRGVKVQVRTFEKDNVYRPKRSQMTQEELQENKGGQRIVTKVNQAPNTDKGLQNIKDGVLPAKSALHTKLSPKEMQKADRIREKFSTEQITSYNKSDKQINPKSTNKHQKSSFSR